MKINTSHVIATLAVIIIALWFLVNSGGPKAPLEQKPAPITSVDGQTTEKEERLPVVVASRNAQPHRKTIRLFGRTEANRTVDVKAKTAGLVVKTPAREGKIIARDTLLCRQGVDARQAVLDQAKAGLKTAEFNLASTRSLVEKGYRSPLQLQSDEANVDAARASVRQAEIELDNVNMRAPFTGVFESQMAEVGDFLVPGQACGMLLELDPLVIAVQLTESQIGSLSEGGSAAIELASGEQLSGTIRLVESQANATTRTFRSEITVPNKDMKLKAGITATVSIQSDFVEAQHIPSKILSLDENGAVGVRYIDYDDRVHFAEVNMIDEDSNGIWVTGLPAQTRIIIEGQDFVSVGSQISPQSADYDTPSR